MNLVVIYGVEESDLCKVYIFSWLVNLSQNCSLYFEAIEVNTNAFCSRAM